MRRRSTYPPIELENRLLLTVEEACDQLGVGKSHLYEYIQRGELRTVKLGKLRRVPVEALREFVRWLELRAGGA